VLKELGRLPEGLASAVLAVSPPDLRRQVDILPQSLHHLAVMVAFPSIRRYRTLGLDFIRHPAAKDFSTPCAVLHTAATAVPALQKVNLQHITVHSNRRLMQPIAAVCSSASDVSLRFGGYKQHARLRCGSLDMHHFFSQRPFAQLGNALLHNTMLTSLQLADVDDTDHGFNLDCILGRLTRLQSLWLGCRSYPEEQSRLPCRPVPKCIMKLHCLTFLSLGYDWQLNDLPQIVPHMKHLRYLDLSGFRTPQLQPGFFNFNQLKDLTLMNFETLKVLPSLASLTALPGLLIINCKQLREFPPLATLTGLHRLQLCKCEQLRQVPPLEALTALRILFLKCGQLEQLPPLVTLTALTSLSLHECPQLQHLPPLANLTALQKVELAGCTQLQQVATLGQPYCFEDAYPECM
jgi:hypothetical protein